MIATIIGGEVGNNRSCQVHKSRGRGLENGRSGRFKVNKQGDNYKSFMIIYLRVCLLKGAGVPRGT